VTKAIILAAGRGSRMKQLTQDLPKPMLPLAGRSILEHVIQRLSAAGYADFAVVTGYRREVIEEHFANCGITFLHQPVPNGTGAAACLARDFAGNDPFLLTFGDILAESADYAAMSRLLAGDPGLAAVAAVRWVEDPWQGAAVYAEAGVMTKIVEKPAPGTSATNWNSAGIYCFRPQVFDALADLPLSPRGEYELTAAVERLIPSRVAIHVLGGVWRDIGRPEDLAAAEADLSRSAGADHAGQG
jgi:NDP-sugar pyrophosphorylase family protein